MSSGFVQCFAFTFCAQVVTEVHNYHFQEQNPQ